MTSVSYTQLVLTIHETADALAVSPRHIARLIARQELPSIKIGRRRLIRREDLRSWLEGRKAA